MVGNPPAPSSGQVIWITGLSGAGNSTIANEIARQLRAAGTTVLLIDGDTVRQAYADAPLGHDREGRLENAYRVGELARQATKRGETAVVATMSLFHRIHYWNRKNLPGYFEVFLKVDLETLRRRDPKDLYLRADSGQEENVVGLDIAVEEPQIAHLVIDNNENREDVGEIAATIIAAADAAPAERE